MQNSVMDFTITGWMSKDFRSKVLVNVHCNLLITRFIIKRFGYKTVKGRTHSKTLYAYKKCIDSMKKKTIYGNKLSFNVIFFLYNLYVLCTLKGNNLLPFFNILNSFLFAYAGILVLQVLIRTNRSLL